MLPQRPRGPLLGTLPPRGPPGMEMQHQMRGFISPNHRINGPPGHVQLSSPMHMPGGSPAMVPPPRLHLPGMMPLQNQMPSNMRPPFIPSGPMTGRPPFQMGAPPPLGGCMPVPSQAPPPSSAAAAASPYVDANGDLWLEAKTGEGKLYYYNARTRESKWSKPNGDDEDNAKPKPAAEETAKADDEKPVPSTEKEIDVKESEEKIVDDSDMPVSTAAGSTPTDTPAPAVAAALPVRPMMPRGFRPPGMPFPPPIGIPPPNLLRLRLPLRPMAPAHTTLPDWTEHRLPDGRVYYHNSKTSESTWDKVTAAANAPPLEAEPATLTSKTHAMEEEAKRDAEQMTPPTELKPPSPKPVVKLPVSKEMPIASVPVPGTVWHIVWTGDEKQFFYNPSSKASVWETPADLVDSEIADRLLKAGPRASSAASAVQSAAFAAPSGAAPVTYDGPSSSKKAKVEMEPVEEMQVDKNTAPPVAVQEENRAMTPEKENRAMAPEEEAELKRKSMTTEERMDAFRQLMLEKGVSAFSTWEKELHKFVFDARYLLVSMKERKQCFERFVRTRADEERKERKIKAKSRKDDFKKLLEESVVNTRMMFSDFVAKHGKDDRFKAIDKGKEREGLFNEYMLIYRRTTKERAATKDETLKTQFMDLLRETTTIKESSQWRKAKHGIEEDPRFVAVENPVQREEWFRDYVETLSKSSTDVEDDRRRQKERDRQERIEASIRHREEEVRNRKEEIAKECDKERGVHLHEKANQHFRALLEDMVRDSDVKWKETRRALRKDPRWENVKPIQKPERERLFNEHIHHLLHRKKDHFRILLDEVQPPLDARWKDVRRKIRDDPRYAKCGNSETREREFFDFMQEKLVSVKADFRSLLRETKTITHKTKRKAEDNSHVLKDIIEILKNDKRYLVLDCMPDERARLLKSYLDELYKKGPPPPPTATNPSSRYRKD